MFFRWFSAGRAKKPSSTCYKSTSKAEAFSPGTAWKKPNITCTSCNATACTRPWSATSEAHPRHQRQFSLSTRQTGKTVADSGAPPLPAHASRDSMEKAEHYVHQLQRYSLHATM